MEHKIKIKLRSRRTELGEVLAESLFGRILDNTGMDDPNTSEGQDDLPIDEAALFAGEVSEVEQDVLEMTTEGILRLQDGRVEIIYDESELTGMEGATTSVSFATDDPELVTMMRGGTVTTALVFEPHRRHICAYHTPFMPFEICVYSRHVENKILDCGTLELDYIIELRGAQAERTRFTMEIRTADEEDPLPRPEVMLKN